MHPLCLLLPWESLELPNPNLFFLNFQQQPFWEIAMHHPLTPESLQLPEPWSLLHELSAALLLILLLKTEDWQAWTTWSLLLHEMSFSHCKEELNICSKNLFVAPSCSSSGPWSFAFSRCCCSLGIDVSSQGPLISVLKNDFRVWKEEAEMDGLLAFLLADWRGGSTGVTQEAIFPPKDGSCEEARSPLLDTPADLFLVVQTVENWNVRSELHRLLQMPPLFFRESKILLKP